MRTDAVSALTRNQTKLVRGGPTEQARIITMTMVLAAANIPGGLIV